MLQHHTSHSRKLRRTLIPKSLTHTLLRTLVVARGRSAQLWDISTGWVRVLGLRVSLWWFGVLRLVLRAIHPKILLATPTHPPSPPIGPLGDENSSGGPDLGSWSCQNLLTVQGLTLLGCQLGIREFHPFSSLV